MFLNFIAVNEKVLNLNSITLIEDQSDEHTTRAVLTTIAGDEITLEGSDAEALFARAELIVQANDVALAQIMNAAAQPQGM